eukprot:5209828-Pyramimonas_sp.AAC.1
MPKIELFSLNQMGLEAAIQRAQKTKPSGQQDKAPPAPLYDFDILKLENIDKARRRFLEGIAADHLPAGENGIWHKAAREGAPFAAAASAL